MSSNEPSGARPRDLNEAPELLPAARQVKGQGCLQDLTRLTDAQLLSNMKALLAKGRALLVQLLRHLAEVERRELFLDLGYSSLFEYCVSELRLSEDETFKRLQAERAARRNPEIYALLESGELSLTAVRMLAPHLKEPAQSARLLEQARGKRSREIERMLASLGQPAPTSDRIRFLAPPPAPGPSTGAPALPLLASPGAASPAGSPPETRLGPAPNPAPPPQPPARVQFSFSVEEAVYRKFERARQLLWHTDPRARCEKVFEAALDALLDKRAPERRARRARPKASTARRTEERAASRHVPESVRREVFLRDGGRCAFVSEAGRRCEERAGLEFDHVTPWALGGRSDDARNIRLLCRAHNQRLARSRFGEAADFRRDKS